MPCELQLNIRNRSSTEECETTFDFQAVKEKSEESTGIRSGSGSTERHENGDERPGPATQWPEVQLRAVLRSAAHRKAYTNCKP
jgi:hypothetical protein